MTAPAKCSMCGRAAGFGPFRGAHVCGACAKRIGALAAVGEGPFRRLREVSEPTSFQAADPQLDAFKRDMKKPIPSDPAETHGPLAVAYYEMGLYDDAVREAGRALRGTADRAVTQVALNLLLSKLLLDDGVALLRTRLLLN